MSECDVTLWINVDTFTLIGKVIFISCLILFLLERASLHLQTTKWFYVNEEKHYFTSLLHYLLYQCYDKCWALVLRIEFLFHTSQQRHLSRDSQSFKD